MLGFRPYRWIRASIQPTTYLGVGMIVVVWAALFVLICEDRERAEQAALLQGGNLSRLLEENVLRVVASVDQRLLLLRELQRENPHRFELAKWADGHEVAGDLNVRFSVIGADGVIQASTHGPLTRSIDVSDREHFRFHMGASEDVVFISKPIVIRTTGMTQILLSRRIVAPDGSFGGVITGSLDPNEFATFYNSIELGPGGLIALVGFDSVIRSAGGPGEEASALIGETMQPAQVFDRYRNERSGSYWEDSDGRKRLIAYRVVGEYPLISVVGVAEQEIFKRILQTRRTYYNAGIGLTILIVVAIGFGLIREAKLAHAKAALEQTNLWFHSALEHMSQGLAMFDAQQRLIICNQQYPKIYRLASEQVRQGTTCDQLFGYRRTNGLFADDEIEKARREGAPAADFAVRLKELRDGRSVLVSSRRLASGGWVETHEDVTERQRAATQIARMARHDALTGLANRTLFLEESKAAAAALERNGGFFSILLLDLDRFKTINDSLGHAAGDALLKEVANRLRASIRASDVLARLGGDEFAIIAMGPRPDGEAKPDHVDEQMEGALVLANRILDAFSAPFDLDGKKLFVGTSIGVALAPRDGDGPEELLKKADLALYETKSSGRNGYSFFDPRMTAVANERQQIEVDMRAGLGRGEFELRYQPIFDAHTRRAVGAEALLRWRHPRHGLMAPGRFIDIAEDTELIVPLGEWALCQACKDAVHWPPHIKLAVNLSAVQFRKGNLLDVILCALVDSRLSPERLEIEITESVLLEKETQHISLLHQLKNIGVAVALDEFGTGYSSLSYLKLFPFDKIKIDRSFTAEIDRRDDCAAIVSSVIGLGRSLNIATTAEGVETDAQFEMLRAAGVTLVQGRLLGEPCPAEELRFAEPIILGGRDQGDAADRAA